MGRITKTFAGTDVLVRSAEVSTAYHTFCRPIGKFVRLPIDSNLCEDIPDGAGDNQTNNEAET